MIMRRIGFKSYDDNDDAKKEEKKVVSQKELFRQFLHAKYAPFGANASMVFRTSRELAYESREMCAPSMPDIAAVMTDFGCKADLFCGQWTWVLYEKETLHPISE